MLTAHRIILFGSNSGESAPEAPSFDSGSVSDVGANVPFIGGLQTPAFYDAGLNKTFLAWEAYVSGFRAQLTTAFDHETYYFSDIEGMGVSPLVDDTHGFPSIVLDHEDYLHGFYGPHNSNMLHSSTRWAWDGAEVEGSHWIIRPQIAGEYTYAHPIMVGSTMYLFMRETQTDYPLVLYETTALAAGVATWGSSQELVNLSPDARFYMGDAILNGTDIWIVATRADAIDENRKGVYVFILDTTDGSIRNYDGSTDTAAGSLPIDLTLANSDYRIFDHGVNRGDIPAVCFDTNGVLHICFFDGTGTSYAIKHVSITAGVLSSTTTIATIKAGVGASGAGTGAVDFMALVPLAGGEIELWYPEDEAEAWNNGGNMTRRVRSAAGSWGAAETVLAATTKAIGRPARVIDGLAIARVAFAETEQDQLDSSAGDSKIYLWGSQGLIGYQQAPAVEIESVADGVELREGGLDAELREDNSDELREVAT